MTKRFVVGVDGLSAEEEGALRAFFASEGNWWHWINNFWLFIAPDEMMAATIRDAVAEIKSSARVLVLRVDDTTAWAGRGPTKPGGKAMFDWIRNNWMEDAD
jgi:hypothetical protein